MTDLVATEALKLRTLVLPRAVLAVGAAGSAVIGYAAVDIAADSGAVPTLAELAVAPGQALWFLTVVVAVLATAGEFQHGTLAATLLQAPRRGPVLAAKTVVAAGYGAGLAVLGAVVSMLAGAVALRLSGAAIIAGSGLVQGVIGNLVLGALWAVLAVGLGALVRNSAVALVSVLVWKFVVEQVIPIVTHTQEVQRWLPSGAADALLARDDASALSPVTGGLLFAGYAATLLLAGALVFIRRDPV